MTIRSDGSKSVTRTSTVASSSRFSSTPSTLKPASARSFKFAANSGFSSARESWRGRMPRKSLSLWRRSTFLPNSAEPGIETANCAYNEWVLGGYVQHPLVVFDSRAHLRLDDDRADHTEWLGDL